MSIFYEGKHYGSGEEFTHDEGFNFLNTGGIGRIRNFGKEGILIFGKYCERIGMADPKK